MDNEVMELLEMLYTMVSEAWGVPLGADKCIVEREKVLNIIEEIKAQMPTELAEAKRLVSARDEFIGGAKREAESIRRAAEEKARSMVDEQEIVRVSRAKANDMLSNAEIKSKELRRVTGEYVDDALRRTEEAVSAAYNEIHGARSRFKTAAAQVMPAQPAQTQQQQKQQDAKPAEAPRSAARQQIIETMTQADFDE